MRSPATQCDQLLSCVALAVRPGRACRARSRSSRFSIPSCERVPSTSLERERALEVAAVRGGLERDLLRHLLLPQQLREVHVEALRPEDVVVLLEVVLDL